MEFLELWGKSALTTLGWFWTAFWAFGLGYLVSATIQVFVSRQRMRNAIGKTNARTVALASFFGFISSSCSFAALATTRSLLAKGAGLVPSFAFLLASTNLVIELGIVIMAFLSWHFVVGEYAGGLLLILVVWLLVRLTRPSALVENVRERLELDGDGEVPDWRALVRSEKGWIDVAKAYFDEWLMVWKDVTVGFTVAGIIAAFVPGSFFTALFPGSGNEATFFGTLGDTLVGPVAAFFTFIGSMGNIPLAGVLFANGVSMAGIMAFIFSDLVVFPVIRVNALFYGWKFALYIAAVFLAGLVVTALAVHYGFALLGLLPEAQVQGRQVTPSERFAFDHTFWLNAGFALLSLGFAWLAWLRGGYAKDEGMDMRHGGPIDSILKWLAIAAFVWIAGGTAVWMIAVA
ncbi:permease [Zhengella sp. ZM62]|uniref:permease n=1 Tax=Zhengella sedimenti TaxID=3390035 RepID=UPI003974C9DB